MSTISILVLGRDVVYGTGACGWCAVACEMSVGEVPSFRLSWSSFDVDFDFLTWILGFCFRFYFRLCVWCDVDVCVGY